MEGKDLHLGCPQLPIEHARALSLRRSEEGQRETRTVTGDTGERRGNRGQLNQHGFPGNTENEFLLDPTARFCGHLPE